MLLILSRVFGSLPSQALNILISPGGDGNLLSQVDGIFLPTTIHKEFTLSSFILIFGKLLISGLVRYLLGHVVATLLIIEIARTDGSFSDQERGNKKRPLTFRSIYGAIRLIFVIIMLAFRLLGLLPASITLILTEVSLLPGKLETLIPSPTKQRGSTIAELRGGRKIAPGLAAFSSALKAFGIPQFMWLIELHLKKCFVQIAIELLILPIIVLAIL
ncbi:hypothetical protein PENVUL_c047G02711 [Penicillium vulpinum]|uniref:Uncharacterized protein n=1 Tax=Penicillium vulpinum TaxID=29845 RepID=A0A1V6RFX3_9EURO|nr:hypothetical protein PENVUL_c047G02711 [Penicillium vulpinum]